MGAWESVANELGQHSGLTISQGESKKFSNRHHTFLTKRFDRVKSKRIHFASAMTLMGKADGASADQNVSYLNIAELIMRYGAEPDHDLEELWRRIVFSICISNSDDHLRNHGFLLTKKGWRLSPAFDINPIPFSNGLHLNISETSNALDLDLAREVAPMFRVQDKKMKSIITKVLNTVKSWREIAKGKGISRNEVLTMENVFMTG